MSDIISTQTHVRKSNRCVVLHCRYTPLDLAMLHDHTACQKLLNELHAPSGGGKYHMAAICLQTAWRAYKKKVCIKYCCRDDVVAQAFINSFYYRQD